MRGVVDSNQIGFLEQFIMVLSRFQGRLSPFMREALAEFISTFILVSFGLGSVAQMVLSRGKFGTFLSVNFAWGIAVTMGCYWAGGVSGAHMNPAVTLAFAVVKRLDWIKVPIYCIAQLLGAFFCVCSCVRNLL